MRGIISAALVLVFVLMAMASCMDEEPAEISVISKLNGKSQSCTINVFTASGKQIQQVPTDNNGIGYIKQVAAGTYILKFEDVSGNPYPAVTEVTVTAGDSLPVNVELSEETAPEDTAPSE